MTEYLNNKNYFHKCYTHIETSYAVSAAHSKFLFELVIGKWLIGPICLCVSWSAKGGVRQSREYAGKTESIFSLAIFL